LFPQKKFAKFDLGKKKQTKIVRNGNNGLVVEDTKVHVVCVYNNTSQSIKANNNDLKKTNWLGL
jgi:hypothetical protein